MFLRKYSLNEKCLPPASIFDAVCFSVLGRAVCTVRSKRAGIESLMGASQVECFNQSMMF